MEALDTYFNGREWNIYRNAKKSDAFIAPVFLINKETLKRVSKSFPFKLDDNFFQHLEEYSSYFWQTNFNKEQVQSFLDFRNKNLSSYQETHFLFTFYKHNNNNEDSNPYGTFGGDTNLAELSSKFYQLLEKCIFNYYSYIYIPVEIPTESILKFEADEMQKLMGKDILNDIKKILDTKQENKKSIIKQINERLTEYGDEIESKVKEIDSAYSLSGTTSKKSLTSNDIVKEILRTFFTIRILRKDSKEIGKLSSGEQRTALIDIASAFLDTEDERNKEIILAIDEPENSLHVSKVFKQFNRIKELSNKAQLLITTHWYGMLPTMNKATLNLLEKNEDNTINSYIFSIDEYFNHVKKVKNINDIYIKSYYELCTSIITSLKDKNEKWIICEGISDKLYFEKYFKDSDNIKIFTVGGIGNVLKLYKYFYIPAIEEDNIQGKILFIVDTDKSMQKLNLTLPSEIKNVALKRYNKDEKKEEVSLVNYDFSSRVECDIEDSLDPLSYYNALSIVIKESEDSSLINAFNKFEFNPKAKTSELKGDYSILEPKEIKTLESKKMIIKFSENRINKCKIANNYKINDKIPNVIQNIKDLLAI